MRIDRSRCTLFYELCCSYLLLQNERLLAKNVKCKNILFLSIWFLGQRNRNNRTHIDFALAIFWSSCLNSCVVCIRFLVNSKPCDLHLIQYHYFSDNGLISTLIILKIYVSFYFHWQRNSSKSIQTPFRSFTKSQERKGRDSTIMKEIERKKFVQSSNIQNKLSDGMAANLNHSFGSEKTMHGLCVR